MSLQKKVSSKMSRRDRGKKEKENVDWEAVGRLDEDCKDFRGFKIKDVLKDEKMEEAKEGMVVNLTGKELTVEYLQREGFRCNFSICFFCIYLLQETNPGVKKGRPGSETST